VASTESTRLSPAVCSSPELRRRAVSELFRENRGEASLGGRSLRGGAVGIIARALNGAIQIGSILCLARLLSPEDYGLVGMVNAMTGFIGVVGLGTPDAIVQRRSITEGEVSAVFWLSVSIGIGSALLLAACAPLIAKFYGEPRLTMIVIVSALPFVLSTLYYQHAALLRRAMRFQELGMIDVTANLLSAVLSVTMALHGFAYWALAIRPVAMTALFALGVWLRCRWIPPRPTTTKNVKEIVKLGLNITGVAATEFLGKSADKVAIGYRIGAKALGYYQNTVFVYDNLLDMLVNCVHPAAIVGLSKATGDPNELRRLWRKALGTLVFYAMPAFGLLAVTSKDVVVWLLGAKWASAGALLSILALRGIPHAIERTSGWLHVAAGRTDRWMRWGVTSTCVQLAGLFCGLPFGPRGVVIASVFCMFILSIPAIAYAGRPLGIGARDVVQVAWRPLAGSAAAVTIGFLLRYALLLNGSAFIRMIALTPVYVAVYLLIVVGLFRLRAPVGVILGLVRDLVPGRVGRLVRAPSFSDPHS
jgi:polysaccharide transporter, PST family